MIMVLKIISYFTKYSDVLKGLITITVFVHGNLKNYLTKIIKSPATVNNILNVSLDCLGAKMRVRFNGSYLKQDKIIYAHKTIVTVYIVYERNKSFNINSYPTLENCLFGADKLTKKKWFWYAQTFFRYGIGLDRKGRFSVGNEFGRNCIIFRVDISSFVHVNNKKFNS